MLISAIIAILAILAGENYHPRYCTPTLYKFALLNSKSHNRYMIHGLWVEECAECNYSCGYPTFCNIAEKNNFNVSQLIPIWKNLTVDYFPGGNPEYNNLLKHEWLKHGTCTNFTELSFFTNTLIIYQKLMHNNFIDKYCNPKINQCFFYLDPFFHIINKTI